MSASIYSEAVDLNELIPEFGGIEREGTTTIFSVTLEVANTDSIPQRKKCKTLVPWIFRHADIVEENYIDNWSEGDCEFSRFSDDLSTYRIELNAKKRVKDASSVMQYSKAL